MNIILEKFLKASKWADIGNINIKLTKVGVGNAINIYWRFEY